MARILVADDDVDIRELVEFKLSTLGHDVVAVSDGAAAIDACQAERPDLAVLDVMMPGVSGLDAIRAIRADPSLADLPVILLTARAQESDVETGFDSGADDYITKPFSPREVVARVRAILKRSQPAVAAAANPGSLFCHEAAARRIRFAGQALALTPSEYRLLATLLARPGQVFSRSQLLDALGEAAEDSFERTIDSHIKTLRAKLRQVRADLDPIVTHRGFGYALE